MSFKKSVILWVISVILMAGFAVYQRMTGPTYPVGGKVTLNNNLIKYSLPRTHGGAGNKEIKLYVPDKSVTGDITLKRYKSHDEWSTVPLRRVGDYLIAEIPHQNPAGKVIYQINLDEAGKKIPLTEKPVIIRFKGDVPDIFTIPHVFMIFLAFIFSMRTGFEAYFKGKNLYLLTVMTTVFLFFAVIILGPIIQYYAFGAFWTGWPIADGKTLDLTKFGDLTDNKSLIAFIMWCIAVWKIRKNKNAGGWAIAASIVLIAVFLIPHSVLGSEIDYTKLPK